MIDLDSFQQNTLFLYNYKSFSIFKQLRQYLKKSHGVISLQKRVLLPLSVAMLYDWPLLSLLAFVVLWTVFLILFCIAWPYKNNFLNFLKLTRDLIVLVSFCYLIPVEIIRLKLQYFNLEIEPLIADYNAEGTVLVWLVSAFLILQCLKGLLDLIDFLSRLGYTLKTCFTNTVFFQNGEKTEAHVPLDYLEIYQNRQQNFCDINLQARDIELQNQEATKQDLEFLDSVSNAEDQKSISGLHHS